MVFQLVEVLAEKVHEMELGTVFLAFNLEMLLER